eukprot:scaffold63938_cov55-Attheya_sp.AAC.1
MDATTAGRTAKMDVHVVDPRETCAAAKSTVESTGSRTSTAAQANHAYQMAAYGPPTQYPPQWSEQQGPPQYPSGPPPNQGAPWGQGYP